jgi:GNAT superfamily N-acetyltransferase
MELRAMRTADGELDRVDGLLMAAYDGTSRRGELDLYLGFQPDGWFVVAEGDEIAAVAGAVAYGAFAWIGLVATDPAWRGRGFATRLSRHLVEWAFALGCRTVALDASDAGRPVYDRLGFEAAGRTLELTVPTGPPEGPGSAATVAFGVDDLLELDRRVFGGDRSAMLRALARDGRSRCHVVHDGGPAGYLFARDRLLGPGCARDAAMASELVAAALHDLPADGNGRRLIVPVESAHVDALLAIGLRERRSLTHMRIGDPVLPGERTRLLAETSFAVG